MHWTGILESSLYFLALVNPASKILFLSSMQPDFSAKEIRGISIRATSAAALILLVLTIAGRIILERIFHIELYSLKVAGGIVLFLVGLLAVRKGRFYEESPLAGKHDMSIVPVAAPLIAGPGTIAGAISYGADFGIVITLISVGTALAVNLVLMLFSGGIGKGLERIHATGPLIRITGLIVAAVAVQMILSGLSTWMQAALHG